MKLILTDIDDTVLKFGDGFQDWCEAKGLKTYGRLRDVCSIENFLDCDRELATELVIEFSTCPKTMPFLKPEPCALEVIPKLHALGWQFTAISSCVDTPEVAQMRRENLEQAFGIPWVDVHCTGLLQPKDDFLNKYEPTYWVEDNAHHAGVGRDLGHTTFLLDRAYNTHFQCGFNPIRVPDWQAIFNIISSLNDDAEEH